MKISAILYKAANEHLWTGEGDWPFVEKDVEVYSCIAAQKAFPIDKFWNFYPKTMAFLQALGCDTNSTECFNEFKDKKTKQAARYAWLMFAAHIAEEENL